MNAQRIEHPPLSDFHRAAGNELAVAALLDYLALPTLTVTPRPDAVHITVTGAHDLSRWMYELGGEMQRITGTGGVMLWTLRTRTPERADGSTVAIHVHAVVVDGEPVLAEVRRGESP